MTFTRFLFASPHFCWTSLFFFLFFFFRIMRNLLVHNLKKKPYGSFLWMGFTCLKATATSGRQFTFNNSVPSNSWYLLSRPRKDERLSQPWSHPVVLSTEPLDWESGALTTRSLLHCVTKVLHINRKFISANEVQIHTNKFYTFSVCALFFSHSFLPLRY